MEQSQEPIEQTIEQSIGCSISMEVPLMAEIARYWIESGIAEQNL